MILYKYLTEDVLCKVLGSNRIAFSHPRDFNDPFDRPRVSRQPYTWEYNSLIDGLLKTKEIQAEEADAAWNECVVSSFTRTHDNSLMWAHYANKHTGAVIEVDTDRAGLMSKGFLIPVQFGSVIYMSRPNPDPGPAHGLSAIRASIIRGGEDRFNIENYEGLQRLFLTKSLSWAYEEEVRVVSGRFPFAWNANNETLGGHWNRFDKGDGNMGYGLALPPGSITRVYTGLRFKPFNFLRAEADKHGFEIWRATNSPGSYDVQFEADGAMARS